MIERLFFDLIRVAIGNQVCLSHTPTADEWGELYFMAKKQSLVGVCFAGVQELQKQTQCPPKSLYIKWMNMAAKIHLKNEHVNRQCVELREKFSADGFKGCILKGQSIAKLYASHLSGLRQSGDIDIWVDGNRNNTIKYVQKMAPTSKVRWLHAHLNVFVDTKVEVHFFPTYMKCPFTDKILQSYFNNERAECFEKGEVSQKMNEVFILAHIYRHFTNEGVGLRQLMDYYFVLKHRQMLIDSEIISPHEFEKLMKLLGMLRFAKGIMWIMVHQFGLNPDKLPCALDKNDGEFLLEEFLKAGNFGHYDLRNKHEVNESALHRFWRLNTNSFRVFRFAPMEVLWAPIWRIKHWCWRKTNGYK